MVASKCFRYRELYLATAYSTKSVKSFLLFLLFNNIKETPHLLNWLGVHFKELTLA